MKQSKRSRLNVTDKRTANKRRKTNVTCNEPINVFEDLANELIYEIFGYLDSYHAFQSFYDLNERFQNIFLHSILPNHINLSSISKSMFLHYLTQIILPHTDRIQSLRISHHFAADMHFFLPPAMNEFSRLRTLIITDIEMDYVQVVIDGLFSLSVLSSLVIKVIGLDRCSFDIYRKIFRLPVLKYCHMHIDTSRNSRLLLPATNKFSSIEVLTIENEVSLEQLCYLLPYVRQLRRLSLSNLMSYNVNHTPTNAVILSHLIHVSLNICRISFNSFQSLVRNFFHQVQIFRLAVVSKSFSSGDMTYLNAQLWQLLISTNMPDLRIFDFQYQCCSLNTIYRQVYQTMINKFSSSYWTEHQWFFECQYYKTKYYDNVLFYSTNPYRRKSFILGGRQIHMNDQVYSIDSVRQIDIHDIHAVRVSSSRFSNVTKLTLTSDFDISRDSIVDNLKRIIPLQQLSQLILQCRRLSFEQFIELLQYTPHLHTVELHCAPLRPKSCTSTQKNGLFQLISHTNRVTNLTIEKEITLRKLQYLIALFPRLESLTINFYEETLESILFLVLSKTNTNALHLSSLCISKRAEFLVTNMRNIIESKNLLQYYTLKHIAQKLFLWW